MSWQQHFNNEKNKKTILIGISLLLLAVIICSSVILQWQFQARIVQIENATITNNNRLNDINQFFILVDQKMQQASNSQAMQNLFSAQ